MNTICRAVRIIAASHQEKESPRGIIFPQQTHSATIKRITTGTEDLTACDGVYAAVGALFALGVKTADCAPICFCDGEIYGVVHAGWRGLVDGIVQKMLRLCVRPPQVFVGPLLPVFEIQKDDCYRRIARVYGTRYFTTVRRDGCEAILFRFRDALAATLPPTAVFDPRSTFTDTTLVSWRRDRTRERNYTIIDGGALTAG